MNRIYFLFQYNVWRPQPLPIIQIYTVTLNDELNSLKNIYLGHSFFEESFYIFNCYQKGSLPTYYTIQLKIEFWWPYFLYKLIERKKRHSFNLRIGRGRVIAPLYPKHRNLLVCWFMGVIGANLWPWAYN